MMDQHAGNSSEGDQINASPLSDKLAISGYFRASDPGRFEAAVEDINDIQMIARRESNTR